MLDMLRRADQRVHKNEKVVGAVVPFLMLKKKIRESLLKCDAGIHSATFHHTASSLFFSKIPGVFGKEGCLRSCAPLEAARNRESQRSI
jgi:hypothetical protein